MCNPITARRKEVKVKSKQRQNTVADQSDFKCSYEEVHRRPHLLRLEVIGAQRSGSTYWNTVDASADIVVKAITSPDDSAEEWNQIVWSGGVEGGAKNERLVSRAAAHTATRIQAELERRQTVHVAVYDLTSVHVAKARSLGADRYWMSVGEQADLTAVTNPAEDGARAQVQWEGAGVAGGAQHRRNYSGNAVASDVKIAAKLGTRKEVSFDVYDLTALAGDLPLDGGKKGYVGYVPGNQASVTATTNPHQDSVWQLLDWNPKGTDGAQANVKKYDASAASVTNIAVKLGGKEVPIKLRVCDWPDLKVKRIEFQGGHDIDCDTIGVFANDWIDGRADQSPLCYTRSKDVTLKVQLTVVKKPTEDETVEIRGKATFDTQNLEWTSNVTVHATDTEVSFPAAVTGGAQLPNKVEVYDPLVITWQMKLPDGTWKDIGTTDHVFYVTLRDPSGTPAYLTLLDYSCRNARGATDPATLVAGVFTPFAGRSMQRKRDNMDLTYWKPANTAEHVYNTTKLLQSADGAGHCGSWAHFLIDMHKVHGIVSSRKINVTRDAQVTQDGVNMLPDKSGFLVKNWTFSAVPVSANDRLTHEHRVDCTAGAKIPGQNNNSPPPAFYNHFVVRSPVTHKIYDPSYGVSFDNQDLWEQAAISGLFCDVNTYPDAGYDTSKAPGRLLKFTAV